MDYVMVPLSDDERREWMKSQSDAIIQTFAKDFSLENCRREGYIDADGHEPTRITLKHSIDTLELDTGTKNFLHRAGYSTIESVMELTPEMLLNRTSKIGPKRFQIIKDALLKHGFDYEKKWQKK